LQLVSFVAVAVLLVVLSGGVILYREMGTTMVAALLSGLPQL
jgi:hypothetical protein